MAEGEGREVALAAAYHVIHQRRMAEQGRPAQFERQLPPWEAATSISVAAAALMQQTPEALGGVRAYFERLDDAVALSEQRSEANCAEEGRQRAIRALGEELTTGGLTRDGLRDALVGVRNRAADILAQRAIAPEDVRSTLSVIATSGEIHLGEQCGGVREKYGNDFGFAEAFVYADYGLSLISAGPIRVGAIRALEVARRCLAVREATAAASSVTVEQVRAVVDEALARAKTKAQGSPIVEGREQPLEPVSTEPTAAPSSQAPIGDTGCVFRREGTRWTYSFAGKSGRRRNYDGMLYIQKLLSKPYERMGVEELVACKTGSGTPAVVSAPYAHIEGIPAASSRREEDDADGIEAPRKRAVQLDRGDDVMDAQTKKELKKRAKELYKEIEELRKIGGDAAHQRIDEALEELASIAAYQKTATGLRDVSRRIGDEADKVRKRVSAAIINAIDAIAEDHQELATHLKKHIELGFSPVYLPPPPQPTWTI